MVRLIHSLSVFTHILPCDCCTEAISKDVANIITEVLPQSVTESLPESLSESVAEGVAEVVPEILAQVRIALSEEVFAPILDDSLIDEGVDLE